MRIKGMQKQPQTTVLEIDTGDPKSQHFHIIPAGVLETRMAAWGLSESEALELLVIESDETVELPDRFTTDDLAAATSKVRSVIASKRVDWAVSKADALSMAALPAEAASAVREHTRAELAKAVRPMPSPGQSMMENIHKGREVAAGYERLGEEYLADEIIATLPDDVRNAPRTVDEDGAPVELNIRFTP